MHYALIFSVSTCCVLLSPVIICLIKVQQLSFSGVCAQNAKKIKKEKLFTAKNCQTDANDQMSLKRYRCVCKKNYQFFLIRSHNHNLTNLFNQNFICFYNFRSQNFNKFSQNFFYLPKFLMSKEFIWSIPK